MPHAVEPFHLAIAQSDLDDLQDRLARTRWPDRETVADASQGPPLAKLRALVDHWRTAYDWRRCEAMLNGWGQHRTEIDGLGIHFLHVRSPEPDALPLLMTHGWPGSVLEFRDAIGPLTDPAAHGGDAGDAFHLVIPSLPGFGFSDRPARTGWGMGRTAGAWAKLMTPPPQGRPRRRPRQVAGAWCGLTRRVPARTETSWPSSDGTRRSEGASEARMTAFASPAERSAGSRSAWVMTAPFDRMHGQHRRRGCAVQAARGAGPWLRGARGRATRGLICR